MMAGKRITKLMQTAVCFFGVAILLSAPSAQALTYDVSLDWTLYGNLDQQIIPVIGDYACAPTSVVNSFVYLQNSYPELYGHALVPDINGTPDIYENDELITVAEILASSSYMDTTDPDGTWWELFLDGKQRYIEERVPGSTVYAAQSPFPWLRVPGAEPPWVEKVLPTFGFLYDALVASGDVEIFVQWGAGGHALTLTGLYWDDANDDGIIDEAEDAWMEVVNPWTGVWQVKDIWQMGPSILRHCLPDDSATCFVDFAAVERPIPEPSSILLAGIGLLGLAAYGRRRRRSA